MNVLVIGRGGREHAILNEVVSSKLVQNAFIAPGNGATSKIAKNVAIEETDVNNLIAFAHENAIDLTIVGPESALEAGIVDKFMANNLKIFGPTKSACQIESSKAYAKKIMDKYEIATASYMEFSEAKPAFKYASEIDYPHVIKYDGLAAGKGVVICETKAQMDEQINLMLVDKIYGDANVIIEEFLDGEEFTLLSLVKNEKVYPLEVSRDFKRAYDGDLGPNTGGMGAICPFDKISDSQKLEALTILKQTASALMTENNAFSGVLYGGFIATKNGVKVIEYNARFGDPETEVVLQKLDNDLVEVLLKILDDKDVIIKNDNKTYVGVCLASVGYPLSYTSGFEITGKLDDVGIFHMGTKVDSGYKTNGGRVLFVSASGTDVTEARSNAYEKVNNIKCDNLFYRKDIGE